MFTFATQLRLQNIGFSNKMNKMRFESVHEATKKHAADYPVPKGRPSEYFGELVFNREKMQKYLDAKTLKALLNSIDNGAPLDRNVADGGV